jgi:putative DNA methylase
MGGEMPYKKKLIEVALPLDDINAEAAREKSIRHGHPSTLHLWWARRPLAACRAVLFAQLVDDPSAHPDEFPTEELQDKERERLFDIIRKLVKWENSTNEEVLEAARAEIRRSCDGNPPPILDPFAGGGSIPLEAQRLGLEAHASDLNPVAVLINKALIEIPPRWANHPPVHPEAENRTRWLGAEGLAEDVRRYGRWMRDEAERRIGHLYPKATLPNGQKANVIAWIWARTVTCPNPACRATMPLASSFWLGKKKGKEAWIKPVVEGKAVRFEIGHGPSGPPDPPKLGRGAKFRCLECGEAADEDYTHDEIDSGRAGAQLMAIAAEGDRQRIYLAPTESHERAAIVPRPEDVPTAEGRGTFGGNAQGRRYGFRTFADYFTNRQLTALTTFSDLVGEARSEVESAALAAGLTPDDATAYATAIATYLAFAADRLANEHSTICTWASQGTKEHVRGTFARQALPMTWDFAEASPFCTSTGSLNDSVERVTEVIKRLPASSVGSAEQRDARLVGAADRVWATDPPYYDNIGYADLADYFYVWLRRSLFSYYPDLFGTMVTPKVDELIATPYRHGGSRELAEQYFEDGFVDVFARARGHSVDEVPISMFYAFKQSDDGAEDGLGSTGWSTMLEGLAAAGWMVTATWPMRTEKQGRSVSIGTNSLASSVVLACRPRPETAGVTDRQGLIRALHAELPGPLHELQKAHIAPVDLRQAAIGPGMAVFSRFARVIEPDGSSMRVRTALGLINQVLDQVLDEQEQDFDAETRWAIHWFSQFYGDEGPYGVAEQLAVSMNVAVSRMVESGIIRSGGGKVRLLGRDELPDSWDPATDTRIPVWEATQHLVKRLETDSEAAAARLLRRLGGGLGESAQLLAYRLYTVCEKARPGLAGPYNALVASWPEIQRLSTDLSEPVATAEQQTFST